jgi:type IV pilus assembly protein PilW
MRCHLQVQRGLTLIEMLVALLISSILSLAIFAVLAVAEGRKRTTTSVNDIGQAGSYAMYAIDKWIRSAGSGFAQSFGTSFGCLLHASNGAQVLPRTAALPAPFNNLNTTGTAGQFRLAPVLIAPGQTVPTASGMASDVLVVMSGAAGFGEMPASFQQFAAPTSNTVTLVNSVSFNAGDLLLLTDELGGGGVPGVARCTLQQVDAAFVAGSATVSLGGTYHADPIASHSLASMSDRGLAMNLGNIGTGNRPDFLVIGVGENNTLFSYDLLESTGDPLVRVVDGVFELHAVYGVDNNDDGLIDSWQAPTSAGFTLAELMAGDETAVLRLRRIKALRVGLILRTSLPEREEVAPASLTMFSDIGLTHTRNLTTAERVFRYRVIESTIPLRNSMML